MRIYLDHNATTPLREEVVAAMAAALREVFGNPSSVHAEGAAARRILEQARERAAALVGAEPAELVFTGSATEANNTALYGHLERAPKERRRLVLTCVEHPSVEEPARQLEQRGVPVTRVPVDREGRIEMDALQQALAPRPAVLAVILANNETGVVQDLAPIAERSAELGVPLHVDATQAVGKIPVDVSALRAATLSASAHKFNGPKGVGLLVQRGAVLPPRILGGPQEKRRRGGTENLAGIVGLGVACELAASELEERQRRYGALRDRLWHGIQKRIPRVRRNGSAEQVLPNTLNVEFEGAAGELLLAALDLEGIAVSAGAACASGSIDPSSVLLAMGRSAEQARACLRFSVGWGVTPAQIDRVVELLPALVERAREAR